MYCLSVLCVASLVESLDIVERLTIVIFHEIRFRTDHDDAHARAWVY
jgi:hypothetical protein